MVPSEEAPDSTGNMTTATNITLVRGETLYLLFVASGLIRNVPGFVHDGQSDRGKDSMKTKLELGRRSTAQTRGG